MLWLKRDRGSQVKGLREIVLIHDLRRQGLSISAIARKVGSDRKTVRKYLEQGLEVPSYGPRPLQGSFLDPYRDYLTERVRAFPDLSGRRLLREIKAMGYEGSYSTLKPFLRVAEHRGLPLRVLVGDQGSDGNARGAHQCCGAPSPAPGSSFSDLAGR